MTFVGLDCYHYDITDRGWKRRQRELDTMCQASVDDKHVCNEVQPVQMLYVGLINYSMHKALVNLFYNDSLIWCVTAHDKYSPPPKPDHFLWDGAY